ncbi:titin homolog [Prorops nasuta]|uniref:titin homolog n=1 Tax=Prorops nasuta TaxID=863751 RepID=UPI0034CF53BF
MASDNEASCASDPNFAVICSFLQCFGKSCGILYPDIARLQEMLENTQEVPQQLIDLHIKLLRKTRKTVSPEKWERALVKFCHTYSNQDGWELERFGYKKARIAVKLRLLKVLLETQFDLNTKFKNEVNKLAANELRVEPLGKDKSGLAYWCQLDEGCNIRVYKEDLDDENWELVAKDRDGMVDLLSTLTNGEIGAIPINEDSNSLEISEKPIIDTGQVSSPSIDEEEGIEENGINTENSIGVESPQIKVEDSVIENQKEERIKGGGATNDNKISKKNIDNHCLKAEEDQVMESKYSSETETSKSILQRHNGNIQILEDCIKEVPIDQEKHLSKREPDQDVSSSHKSDIKPVIEKKLEEIDKPIGVKTEVEDAPVKSIETPVITSPLKLVNIAELKQEGKILSPMKKHNHVEEGVETGKSSLDKLPSKSNFPYPSMELPVHSKLSVKPIDQLAANLVRMQSEKLEKPCGTKSLEKIAENLARSGGTIGAMVNGEDERVSQEFVSRNQADKSSSLRGHRGMDLSASPRSWESANEQNRPVDFSGMDLSSRKFNKGMDLPSTGYRSQEFQHREMDLSTKKPSKSEVQNLPYDARAVMLRNHAMVADLSKRQMPPFTPYEMSSVSYHNASRIPTKDDHRLPSYAILPDPSKLAALRMAAGGAMKRPLETEEPQADVLKRLRADVIPPRGPIDKRSMIPPAWREDVGEAIEEPVMMVHGEGSGSDCDGVNPAIGESIEEPIIYFYGEGSGADCNTGNPGDETSTDNKESNESKTEADSATATLSPNRIMDDSLINEVSTQSIVANKATIKLNRNFPQTSVSVKSDNCDFVDSTQEKPKFKPTLGVQIFPKSVGGTVKRLSRWDVGKPVEEKAECDSSIISNEKDISQMQNTNELQPQSKELNVPIAEEELCNSKAGHEDSVTSESLPDTLSSVANAIEKSDTATKCDSSVPSSCQPDTSNRVDLYASTVPESSPDLDLIDANASRESPSTGTEVLTESENIVNTDDEPKSSTASPPRFFFGPNCVSYTSKPEDEAMTQPDETVSTSNQSKSDTLQYECVSSSRILENAPAADESSKLVSPSELPEPKEHIHDDNLKETSESSVEILSSSIKDTETLSEEQKSLEIEESLSKDKPEIDNTDELSDTLENTVRISKLVSQPMEVDLSIPEERPNEASTTKNSESSELLTESNEQQPKIDTNISMDVESIETAEVSADSCSTKEITEGRSSCENLQAVNEDNSCDNLNIEPSFSADTNMSMNIESMETSEMSADSCGMKEIAEGRSSCENLQAENEDNSCDNLNIGSSFPVDTSNIDNTAVCGNIEKPSTSVEHVESEKIDNVDSTVNSAVEEKEDVSEVQTTNSSDEKVEPTELDADSMTTSLDKIDEGLVLDNKDKDSNDSTETTDIVADTCTAPGILEEILNAETNENSIVSSSVLEKQNTPVPVTSSSGEEYVQDTPSQANIDESAGLVGKGENICSASEVYSAGDIPSTSSSPTSDVNKNIVSSVGFEEVTNEFLDETLDNPSSCVDQDSNEEMIIDDPECELNESPKVAVGETLTSEAIQEDTSKETEDNQNTIITSHSSLNSSLTDNIMEKQEAMVDTQKESPVSTVECNLKNLNDDASMENKDSGEEFIETNQCLKHDAITKDALDASSSDEVKPLNDEEQKSSSATESEEVPICTKENKIDVAITEDTVKDSANKLVEEPSTEISKSLVANYDSDSNDNISDDVFETDIVEPNIQNVENELKNVPEYEGDSVMTADTTTLPPPSIETSTEKEENIDATEKQEGQDSEFALSTNLELAPSKDLGLEPSKDFKFASSKDLELATSKDLELAPSKDLELATSKDLELAPSKDLELAPSKDLEHAPSKDLEHTLSKDLELAPSKEIIECNEVMKENEIKDAEECSEPVSTEERDDSEPITIPVSIQSETESSIKGRTIYPFQADNNRESKDYLNSPLNNLNSFVENAIRKVENEEKASSRNTDMQYASKVEIAGFDSVDRMKDHLLNHVRMEDRVTNILETKDQFVKPINAISVSKVEVEHRILKEESKIDNFVEEAPIIQSCKKLKEDIEYINDKNKSIEENIDMVNEGTVSLAEFNEISSISTSLSNSIDVKADNSKDPSGYDCSNYMTTATSKTVDNYYNDISVNFKENSITSEMDEDKSMKSELCEVVAKEMDETVSQVEDTAEEVSKVANISEIPQRKSLETVEAPIVAPIEAPIEAPVESSIEATMDAPIEAPIETSSITELPLPETIPITDKFIDEQPKEHSPPVKEIVESEVINEPSNIQNVDVDPMMSDDSMGIDNEGMFDAPVEETDPLAYCADDDTLKNVNDALADVSSNFNPRVKPVEDLYEGWKLDGTEEPSKVSRKRRNSTHESNSDDGAENQDEEDEEAGGKRIKLRAKRLPDKQLRKAVEDSRAPVTSDDEGATKSMPQAVPELEEKHDVDNNAVAESVLSSSKKHKGRPKGGRRRKKVRRGSRRPKRTDTQNAQTPGMEASETTLNTSQETSTPTSQKKRKKRKMVLGLEIGRDIEAEVQPGSDETPVRQSRRIAQLKIKEEADRRRIEEEALSELKEKKENADKKKRKKQKHDSEEEAIPGKDIDKERKLKKKKRKRRKKKMLAKFNEANPWQSSSGSSSDDENDNDDDEEDDDDMESEGSLLFKSDHEFSPESDLEKDQAAEPLRRARTAQKSPSDIEEADDEYACQKCGKADHPEWILLCDSCDKGWHCSCLRPALMLIPEGDWFCPPCQHNLLVVKLRESLKTFDQLTKRHENEVLRKKRLAFVGISLDNVLQKNDSPESQKDSSQDEDDDDDDDSDDDDSSSSSTDSSSGSTSTDESEPVYQLRERRCANTYKFNEYDDMINAAIQDEVEAVQGAGNQGRGKDIATIVNAEKEEAKRVLQAEALKIEEELEEEEKEEAEVKSEKESDEEYKVEQEEEIDDDEYNRRKSARKLLARKKHRKLNSLDISSEDDPESDEDFKGSGSEDEEEEEEDDHVTSSDDSFTDLKRRSRKGDSRPVRRSTRARMTRYDEDFINDDSDDSDRPKRKKSRSTWGDSESEDSDNSWRQRKKKSKTLQTTRPRPSSKSKTKKKKKRKRIIESDNQSEEDEEELKIQGNPFIPRVVETEQPAELSQQIPNENLDVCPPIISENSERNETLIPNVPELTDISTLSSAPAVPILPVVDLTVVTQEEPIFQKKKKEIVPKKKAIRRKIIYGGLPDENRQEEEEILSRRTRGRKINYQEVQASDSEEELKKALRKTGDSEDEFVVNDGDDLNDDAEKDSDSGDIYSPNKDGPKFKSKSPKNRRMKKSPGAKRKSFCDDGTPKQRKKPGPKPGSKNKPRKSNLMISPVPNLNDIQDGGKEFNIRDIENTLGDVGSKFDESLPDNIGFSGTTISVAGSFTGDVPEGSLPGLGSGELEGLDEEQLEQMMMEDEEYGRRQLELAAIEIAKKKKKEEREAKKMEKARLKALEILAAERQRDPNALEGTDGEVPKKKKRGRRSKAEILAEQMRRDGAPALGTSMLSPITGMVMTPDMASSLSANINPNMPSVLAHDMERVPEGQLPLITGPDGQLFNPDGTPVKPKRRGRGKGKKTLALEAARAAEAAAKAAAEAGLLGMGTDSNPDLKHNDIPNVLPTPGSSTSGSAPSTPPAISANTQGQSATQPNSQSVYPPMQPGQQSSVITRMLQSQPVASSPQSFTAAAAAMGHKYFGAPNQPGAPLMAGPRTGYEMQSRGRIPSPYRQPGQSPMPPHFAAVRSGTPPMRMRVAGPQMYHTPHHPMDPSPSGGGPISINSRDRSSPLAPGTAMIPPSAGSPLASKGGPTPPPPPYARGGPPISRFADSPLGPRHQMPPFTNASPVNHGLQQPSPPPNRPPGGNFSPYHPPPPPNYHYGAYPPPPPMSTADDAAYQGSPYPAEHFSSPGDNQPPPGIPQAPPPPPPPSSQQQQQPPPTTQQPQPAPPHSHPGPHPGAHPSTHPGAHPAAHPGAHPGPHAGPHPGPHPGAHPGGAGNKQYDEEGKRAHAQLLLERTAYIRGESTYH